jgi:hypothetical protein
MTTIDKILKEIASDGFEKFQNIIPKRDVKILKNLSILINKPDYISENQGKLLLKILGENVAALEFLNLDLPEVLKEPRWLKLFRQTPQIRKIRVFTNDIGEKFIDIEFNFSTSLKKIVQNISQVSEGGVIASSGKCFRLALIEKNVVVVVEAFKHHNFDISPEILEFYHTIKSWTRDDYAKDFEIFSEKSTTEKTKIKEKLQVAGELPYTILADRKIQYQYQFQPDFSYDTLTEKIANRTSSKVYIDSTKVSLTELLNSLKELHRFPLLVVFNGYSDSESLKNLEKLSSALENTTLDNDVGIYFRFENTHHGKLFNQIIADKKYNVFLNNTTQCAGIIGGKIPKFFLTTNWKPEAVISFTNNLKHNKTSVYCNSCDLIIYYNEKEPLAILNNDL